jgi:hypothetical protein
MVQASATNLSLVSTVTGSDVKQRKKGHFHHSLLILIAYGTSYCRLSIFLSPSVAGCYRPDIYVSFRVGPVKLLLFHANGQAGRVRHS